MIHHDVVRFFSDGAAVEGDLFRPGGEDQSPLPAIVLAQGFSVPRFLGLPDYAQLFAEAGFAALVIDYRGWGSSGGERHRLIPLEQVEDLRNAVTYLQTRADIDADRIALWGASLGGGHVVYAGAFDERVKAIVSQVGIGDGADGFFDTRSQTERADLLKSVDRARRARVRGEPEEKTNTIELLNSAQVQAFVSELAAQAPDLTATLSWRTAETLLEYRPIDVVARVAPRPILFLAADKDDITRASRIHELYERAGEPKKFVSYDVKHYDMYAGQTLLDTAGEAVKFFTEHL